MDKLNPQVKATLDRISVPMHSCIRLEAANPPRVVYADPYNLKGAPHDADVVLVTHEHYDHYSPDDIAKIRKPTTVFVLPESMAGAGVEATLGAENVRYVAPGGQATAAGIPVEAVAAYNVGNDFHTKASAWVGYVVEADGVRTYIAGDTEANPENLQVKCDIACVPAGGTYTFTAQEAADFVKRIGCAAAVPTHYGSVVGTPEDGAAFAAAVDGAVHVELKL